MANITITIPDAALARVVNALCAEAGVEVTNANAKQAVINYIKRTVKQYEWSQAEAVRIEAAKVDDASMLAAKTATDSEVEAIAIG